jgi:8-oxo-dGTP pyrophosphatase MutT (NUDIX family)
VGSDRDQVANVDVFLILRDRAGRLLLGRRGPGVYHGGQWNLVSGKADDGEDAVSAVIREAAEEAGIRLAAGDLTPAAVVHYRGPDGRTRVGFAFAATHDPARHGSVVNAEPHKCDELDWFAPESLPRPLEPYNATILATSRAAVPIGLGGWPT